MKPEPLGWCVVEQLGHRRLAGYLTEVELAGAGFLRLDIPEAESQSTEPQDARTMLLAPSSIYAIHPCGEAEARAAAELWRPEPVERWRLQALDPAPAATEPQSEWTDPFEPDEEPGHGDPF